MRTLAYLASGALMATVAALPAAAGDFDGSKLLICAPVEAMDCAPGSACEKSTPDEVGAPAFIRIDVGNKVVRGPKRTSAIQVLEKTDQQLLLQGTELGYGWTLVIDQETGKMSATLANREGAFVLFGPCTTP
jgi:hypothetical protein